MEINDYVRTKDGKIGKYIKPELGKPYITNGISFNEGANHGKHSKDIIDLIEKGDICIDYNNDLYVVDHIDGGYVFTTTKVNKNTIKTLVDYQIKKVLTKQQFEVNAYKIEREMQL